MSDVIEIAACASVLVVEDTQSWIDWFRSRLPGAEFVDTSQLAIEAFTWVNPETIFIDFQLHYFTSTDFANHVAQRNFAGLVVIHSTHTFGSARLKALLPDAIVAPFGTFEIEKRRRGSIAFNV